MGDASATASTNEPTPDGRAQAVADSIVELIGIFTHDLSNPLQSLTVLLELTLDDLAPGSEEHAKLRQSLEATERMRNMIRDFAGLSRTGRSEQGELSFGEAYRRAAGVLRRRFERHKMRVKMNIAEIEDLVIPHPCYEMVLLGLLMSAVASASDSEHATFELTVHGSIPKKLGGKTARLEVGLSGHRHVDQTLATMKLGMRQVRRSQAILGDAPGRLFVHPNDAARLEFPVGRREEP